MNECEGKHRPLLTQEHLDLQSLLLLPCMALCYGPPLYSLQLRFQPAGCFVCSRILLCVIFQQPAGGTTLLLTAAPGNGSNVEVKFHALRHVTISTTLTLNSGHNNQYYKCRWAVTAMLQFDMTDNKCLSLKCQLDYSTCHVFKIVFK